MSKIPTERLGEILADLVPGEHTHDLADYDTGDTVAIQADGVQIGEVYGYGEFPCFDGENEEAIKIADANRNAYLDLWCASPGLAAEVLDSRARIKEYEARDAGLTGQIFRTCKDQIAAKDGELEASRKVIGELREQVAALNGKYVAAKQALAERDARIAELERVSEIDRIKLRVAHESLSNLIKGEHNENE